MSIKRALIHWLATCSLLATPAAFGLDDAVDIASRYVGNGGYVSGGNNWSILLNKAVFDCSGLTWYAFGHLGIEIPTIQSEQAAMDKGTTELKSPKVSSLERGDLLFFDAAEPRAGKITHVGLYEGNNVFIHAQSDTAKPNINQRNLLTDWEWEDRLLSARRLPIISGVPSNKFLIGDLVEVTSNNVPVIDLRREWKNLGSRSTEDKGKILFGPVRDTTVAGVSYWWWQVDFDTGVDGWVAEDALRKVGSASANFRWLGDLPGGVFVSSAEGVSPDGRVVVGYGHSSSGLEAFRWTINDGMRGLGDFPGGPFSSAAQAVSANGDVVGTGVTGTGFRGFRWTVSTGMVGIGDPSSSSTANGVSANGNVIVGAMRLEINGGEAMRWTQGGGMVGLGLLPGGYSSTAFGVSADGNVVVGYGTSSNGSEAFRWTVSGGMRGLGDLPGGGSDFNSIAYGVSADGNVVVGYGTSSNGFEAFRWTVSGGMRGLGDLPGGEFYSLARAVSGNGSIVVGYGISAAGPEAFIWDSARGMRSLRSVLSNEYGVNLAGWWLSSANGITPDGKTIVGWGYGPNGAQAWVVELP